MTAHDLRRGWCPGMLRPMATGDGLLVRLHPALGRLEAEQLRAIATAAQRFGNGLIDVSSRANLQIRGVTPDTHPALVEHLVAAGLADGTRPAAPYRLTLTSPLAGADPHEALDGASLAHAIETACADIAGLPPKTAIVVDGRGSLPLDDVEGDLRLVALDAETLALGMATTQGMAWSGTLAREAAPSALRTLLEAFASMASPGRIRDLSPASRAGLLDRLDLGPPVIPAPVAPAAPVGIVSSGNICAAMFALPYGRCRAVALERIALWSETFGRSTLSLTPWRGIAIPHVATENSFPLMRQAGEAGFLVAPDDPRLSIAACPGAPDCTKGTTATHRDADALAARLPAVAKGLTVHVSGCPKGCAHPGNADLTLIGQDGAYEVVPGGGPRDKSGLRLPIETILTRLTQAGADPRSAFSKFQP